MSAEFDRADLRWLGNTLSDRSIELKAANNRFRAVVDLGLRLASDLDPRLLPDGLCDAVREAFGVSYVTLGSVDPETHTLQRLVTSGAGSTAWITAGQKVEGLLARVVLERQTLRGENIGGDPTRVGFPALHPEVCAYLATPIASTARVFGWICLADGGGRTFSEDDEHLLMNLAGQAASLHESALLRAEAQHAQQERDRAQLAAVRVSSAVEERHRATEASEERMRFAVQHAGVGIWDMDWLTGVLSWSEIVEAQYGLAPGTFKGTLEAFMERVHPDDRASLAEALENAMVSGADFSVQYRVVRPDGTIRFMNGMGRVSLDENGKATRGAGISLDVTERRKLEDRYQQSQKMESVGRLAGGVAHDLNNLLTVILGYCDLLLSQLQAGDPHKADIAQIQKAGNRAGELTRQLLAFSRKQIVEPTLLDLNLIATEMQPMLSQLVGADVKMVMALATGLWPLKADRGQVEQVVMNLAVNARDAMPTGGTLTVETTNVDLDAEYAAAHVGVQPGAHVRLTVTDTGTGMTPEVQTRVFEPFFTTKPPGKGSGLGMATVFGIVAGAGGFIDVHSRVGKGTSFIVHFPRVAAAAAEVALSPPVPLPQPGVRTILLVEDEEGVRSLASRLLVHEGHTVWAAANAKDATRMFQEHPAIDLLLTDVVMPGGSGADLARDLLKQRPALSVVYMSGYAEEGIVHHGVLNSGIAFLHKPFTATTLTEKIREVAEEWPRLSPAVPHTPTAGTILIVDDESQNVEVVERLMARLGYEVMTATSGMHALRIVNRHPPDLVLLDVNMPGMSGFEVCRQLKADPATRLIPVMLLTTLKDTADRVRGIEAGADACLSKPLVVPELEARVRSLTRLKRYTDELDSAEAVILSLGLTIEARDPRTEGHCQRLARYATALGSRLGLGSDQLLALNRGGYLHDIGKIGIPDSILLKPGRLTPEEYSVIQQHTIIGDRLCGDLRFLEDVRPIVRHHHERPNGTGYPDRLKGEEIPALARILSVVDVFDALTTVRPYKGAMPQDEAISELRVEAGRGWLFESIVEEFVALVLGGEFEQLELLDAVRLSRRQDWGKVS